MNNRKSFFTEFFTPKAFNSFITFNNYNSEFLRISTPNINIGNRIEISHTLSRYLQTTSVLTQNSKHFFVSAFKDFSPKSIINSAILQFCHELKGSSQLKFSFSMLRNLLVCQYQTIISKHKEVFSQLENSFTTLGTSLAIKMVKPAYDASNLVYIFNAWQSFGNIGVGCELIGIENALSFTFGGRIASNNSVVTVSSSKLNKTSLSIYRKITNFLEIGVECKNNDENKCLTGLVAGRIRNKNTEIKVNINHLLNPCFSWDENLTRKFSVGISGEYDNSGLNYGFQMTYDG